MSRTSHAATSRPALIEVHVEQIEQLFYSIDPSPFHARDLDPQADRYIVACARELPRSLPLALVVHLDCVPEQEVRLGQVEGAIRSHFAASAQVTRTQLRDLFRRGRISLLIGGWVAMWRPMEIFLYDWWPVRARIRLLDRLAVMPKRIVQRRRHRTAEANRKREPDQDLSAPAP